MMHLFTTPYEREQRVIKAQVEAMTSAVHRTMADITAKDLFHRVAYYLVPEHLKSNAFSASLDRKPTQWQHRRAKKTQA